MAIISLVKVLPCVFCITTACGASLTLAWDPSPSLEIIGYKIYCGPASGAYTNTTDVGSVTSATIPDLIEGASLFFAVTAYDSSGNESDFSNEIQYIIPKSSPTIAVAGLKNTAYTAPASINLAATVAANGHSIVKVQYFNGPALLGESSTTPFNFQWSNVNSGAYTIIARLFYDGALSLDSSPAFFNVTNLLPVITLSSPLNGTAYSAPAIINLAATAVANGHLITKVQFYTGSTLLGEDSSAPFTWAWANVTAGSYSVSAKLVYDSGSTMSSSPLTLTVSNPSPAIALTSPGIGAVYTAPATINLTATAGANGHSINKVQFYNGSTLLGEDLSAPFSLVWTNVESGNYAITARLVYDTNKSVTSPVVGLTVNGLPVPWQLAEIGNSHVAGSAGLSGSLYTLNGSGSISGLSDSFSMVYQPLTEDGEIIVKINSTQNSSSNACSGVMIRESLTSGSKFVFLGTSGGNQFLWRYRGSTGGSTISTFSNSGSSSNVWVRLTRVGGTFTGYVSTDGTNWILSNSLSSFSITMASNIYFGVATCSGVSNSLNTLTFTTIEATP